MVEGSVITTGKSERGLLWTGGKQILQHSWCHLGNTLLAAGIPEQLSDGQQMNIMEGDSYHDPDDTIRTEEMKNKCAQESEQTGKVGWQSNICPNVWLWTTVNCGTYREGYRWCHVFIVWKEGSKEPWVGQRHRPEPEARRHLFTKKGCLVPVEKQRKKRPQRDGEGRMLE